MSSPSPSEAPLDISVVIPVYNEEKILRSAVLELRERLAETGLRYEIVLAENGSRDQTVSLAAELGRQHAQIRCLSVPEPNYGKALRAGILAARAPVVICDEIDLCYVDFYVRALELLRSGADLVIGSKLIGGAEDRRPFVRHAASLAYTSLLRRLLGFQGTDTHGLKGFWRERLLPVVESCVIEHDVFASELVIRAYRAKLSVREVPIQVAEKRPPSINLLRRVPNVVKSLARLTWAIRVRG